MYTGIIISRVKTWSAPRAIDAVCLDSCLDSVGQGGKDWSNRFKLNYF